MRICEACPAITLSLFVFCLVKIDMGGPSEPDVCDLDRLRLPVVMVAGTAGRRRVPRHRPGEPFIKGPISHSWIASACQLPGVGLHVAMAYRFYRDRFRFERRGLHWGVPDVAKGLRISDDSARRGLHAAELAGLLAVERTPGCKLAVSVLDLPEPAAESKRRPLYGPIPWSWWLPASRLPGKPSKLRRSVGSWRVGTDRPSSSWRWTDWAEFGLSRFSASRGLDALERAELASVGRMPGRSPIVTILDATGANS